MHAASNEIGVLHGCYSSDVEGWMKGRLVAMPRQVPTQLAQSNYDMPGRRKNISDIRFGIWMERLFTANTVSGAVNGAFVFD